MQPAFALVALSLLMLVSMANGRLWAGWAGLPVLLLAGYVWPAVVLEGGWDSGSGPPLPPPHITVPWLILMVGGGIVVIIMLWAALRLAAPDSWWARRFYSDEQIQQARNRKRSGFRKGRH